MLEVGMIVCLALMGVYFFKSTDLPKELKEKSIQSQKMAADTSNRAKKTFPKVQAQYENKDIEAKLLAMKQQKKLKDIALLQAEIDRLTMEITTLEQLIRDNNTKNIEIQKQIDAHFITLIELQSQISSLA